MEMFAAYLKEKADIELIKSEHGFITYEISANMAIVHDMWITPEFRRKKHGSYLVSLVIEEGKMRGAIWLASTIQINTNDFNQTLIAQLNYGFKVVGANESELKLLKEI